MKMYGIPNCDTIKKAKKWLDSQDLSYEFHNYKKDGIDKSLLKQWVKAVGWETLLNKRGTTWRKLDDSVKHGVNEASAIEIMIEQPSIIKRPVLVAGDTIIVGFNESDYQELA